MDLVVRELRVVKERQGSPSGHLQSVQLRRGARPEGGELQRHGEVGVVGQMLGKLGSPALDGLVRLLWVRNHHTWSWRPGSARWRCGRRRRRCRQDYISGHKGQQVMESGEYFLGAKGGGIIRVCPCMKGTGSRSQNKMEFDL